MGKNLERPAEGKVLIMLKRKLLILLLSIALVFSGSVDASLESSLDSMFMSNATPPQAYNSQSRGGFVGGGLSVRAPISNINLVAFDPPRLAAGCGGIDMYGGSFTFINSAQLTALFRQIAANAAAALFKMAIDSISPEIGKIMQDFQTLVHSLNTALKNTCAIGTMIAHDIGDPIAGKQNLQNDAQATNTATGAVTDAWNALSKDFTTPQTDVNTAAATGAMPGYGNLVWRALAESNAGSMLGSPGASFTQTPTVAGGTVDPISAASNEIVMSLVGTLITVQPPSAAAQAAGVPAAPTQINGVEISQGGLAIAHTINLWDFMNKRPPGDEIKILRCGGDFAENGCLNPMPTSDTTWEGMTGYVNRIMYGQVDDTAGVQAGSLIANLNTCATSGCTFTAEQTRFIATISAPVLKLLKDVQRDQSAMSVIAQMIAPVIAIELLERYGVAAETAARNVYSGVKNTRKHPEFATRMQELNAELISIREIRMSMQNKIIATKQYADLLLQNDPGLFARISAGR